MIISPTTCVCLHLQAKKAAETWNTQAQKAMDALESQFITMVLSQAHGVVLKDLQAFDLPFLQKIRNKGAPMGGPIEGGAVDIPIKVAGKPPRTSASIIDQLSLIIDGFRMLEKKQIEIGIRVRVIALSSSISILHFCAHPTPPVCDILATRKQCLLLDNSHWSHCSCFPLADVLDQVRSSDVIDVWFRAFDWILEAHRLLFTDGFEVQQSAMSTASLVWADTFFSLSPLPSRGKIYVGPSYSDPVTESSLGVNKSETEATKPKADQAASSDLSNAPPLPPPLSSNTPLLPPPPAPTTAPVSIEGNGKVLSLNQRLTSLRKGPKNDEVSWGDLSRSVLDHFHALFSLCLYSPHSVDAILARRYCLCLTSIQAAAG